MSENEIEKEIVDICFRVHRDFGPGLFESVNEEIFCHELIKRKISFVHQQPIRLVHEEVKMDAGFRIDVIVENKVIVELKSIDDLAPVHFKQVQTYLKLAGLKLGILVNFNVAMIRQGMHRVVNNL